MTLVRLWWDFWFAFYSPSLHRHHYQSLILITSRLPTGLAWQRNYNRIITVKRPPSTKNKEKLVRPKWVDGQIRREKRKEMIRHRNYYEYWLWLRWPSTHTRYTTFLFTAFPFVPLVYFQRRLQEEKRFNRDCTIALFENTEVPIINLGPIAATSTYLAFLFTMHRKMLWW